MFNSPFKCLIAPCFARSQHLEEVAASLRERIKHLDDMVHCQQKKVKHMVEEVSSSKAVVSLLRTLIFQYVFQSLLRVQLPYAALVTGSQEDE